MILEGNKWRRIPYVFTVGCHIVHDETSLCTRLVWEKQSNLDINEKKCCKYGRMDNSEITHYSDLILIMLAVRILESSYLAIFSC